MSLSGVSTYPNSYGSFKRDWKPPSYNEGHHVRRSGMNEHRKLSVLLFATLVFAAGYLFMILEALEADSVGQGHWAGILMGFAVLIVLAYWTAITYAIVELSDIQPH